MNLLNDKACTETFLDTVCVFLTDIDEKTCDSITSVLLNKQIIQEINSLPPNISVEFGESLRDFKCTISDDEHSRKHSICLKYNDSQKLKITSLDLPHSHIQDQEYNSIDEVVMTLKTHINSMANYLHQLECIDNLCTVMEPAHPSFKDEFRRIALDDRTWLHIEITYDGLATNIHLVGHSELLQDKLQVGLLKWDHDKNIVDNIMDIFDLPDTSFSQKYLPNTTVREKETEIICGICFCVELPEKPGMPQPLCKNSTCEVYFHKYCLFQWLVACDGGRLPAFGVASGNCPTCLQSIARSEYDS